MTPSDPSASLADGNVSCTTPGPGDAGHVTLPSDEGGALVVKTSEGSPVSPVDVSSASEATLETHVPTPSPPEEFPAASPEDLGAVPPSPGTPVLAAGVAETAAAPSGEAPPPAPTPDESSLTLPPVAISSPAGAPATEASATADTASASTADHAATSSGEGTSESSPAPVPGQVAPESAVEPLGASPPPPPPPALPAQPVPKVPPTPQPHDLSRIAQDLQIRKQQVEAVLQLLEEQNTVPFIARYRKDRTGGLSEEIIRRIQERIQALRSLADRKQAILKSIALHGKLTEELTQAILSADHPKRLEDLYLPFKTKKSTAATEAKEKGLEPLALAIWNRDPAVDKLEEVLPSMLDGWKQLHDVNDVLTGVKHILAELISELASVRGPVRQYLWENAFLVSKKVETLPEGKGQEYRDYFDFRELIRQMPPHRVLAVNRGEREHVVRVWLECDKSRVKEIVLNQLAIEGHPHRELLQGVVEESLEQVLLPGLEKEIRKDLTDLAQAEAVRVFGKNLRSLLLQPPLRDRKVLAIDPGVRTGSKVVVLDESGQLLDEATIHPVGATKKLEEAKRRLEQLIRKHQISVVALGNGSGCRETEQLLADLIAEFEHRRLHPAPVLSAAPGSSGSEAPGAVETIVSAPTSPPPDAPLVETSLPTLSVTPAVSLGASGEGFISPITATELVVGEGIAPSVSSTAIPTPVTLTTEVPAPSGGEVSGTADLPSTSATVTPSAAEVSAVSSVTPTVAPPEPVISLEGLPPPPDDLAYVIVLEAGASDYAVSPLGREEFPDRDTATRAAISIGRRLQDPLSELVKIDPQHVGVGLYQHDVKPKELKHTLEAVIESCVNAVGVDLNKASASLLRHVSGFNVLVAREIVEYRKQHGPFKSREQLKTVPQMNEARFIQSAGFVKVPGGDEPLDATWIHPEHYAAARQILADVGLTASDLFSPTYRDQLSQRFANLNVDELAARLGLGPLTTRDILTALEFPGRDPRQDLPPPIFKKGILKIEDISPGMELKGTVLNVVTFGAFVDIGLKESGLVHISQMANRYIKSPYDIVSVGDVVTVWVLDVKTQERKISLTMIPPGTERRPPERRGPGERRPPTDRRPTERRGPPRGDRSSSAADGGRPAEAAARSMPHPPRGERRPHGRGGPPRPAGPTPSRGGGQPPATSGNETGLPPGKPPAASAATESPPPPPPRKPPRPPKPLPKLSEEKKSGKSALNTFAELAAFFKTKTEASQPPPPPAEPAAKSGDVSSATPTEASQPTPAESAPPAASDAATTTSAGHEQAKDSPTEPPAS